MTPAPLVALLRVLVAVCALGASTAWAQGMGSVAGRVFDADSGAALGGATVVLQGAAPADGSAAFQQVATTGADGAFRFSSVPEGGYTLSFTKSGYRASRLADLTVQAGQTTNADFPLPRGAAGTAEQVLELDAFTVEASTVEEGADLLELRLDADQFLNTLSAEEFAKFAASDVADALKRVAGVNVVGGQFAVIRGLEDRYNSTLYNSAPIPSPDPDRQSVQLDLFPSDIVSNLVVSKTFVPELPSNTSGGAINIITHDYPEKLQIKLSGGGGFETKALDRFLRLDEGSPVGIEEDWEHVLESDYGGSIGGRRSILGREVRFKGLVNREIDFRTAEGFQESREPRQPARQPFPPPGTITRAGDLSLGELFLSGGRFDLTTSERTEQRTGYGGLGFDLDRSGDHRLDGSIFYTKKDEEIVQLKENGYFPKGDYERFAQLEADFEEIFPSDFLDFATLGSWLTGVRQRPRNPPSTGHPWFASFFTSESFVRDRDLNVYQLNGDHRIAPIEGLHFSWAANRAETTQEETSYAARIWYEPDDLTQIPTSFPTTPDSLGPGTYYARSGINFSQNQIEETQDFVRLDGDYERDLGERLRVRVNGGFWYEKADREVDSVFLESPTVRGSSQFALGDRTLEGLGGSLFDRLDRTTAGNLSGLRSNKNESSREITAWQVGSKATIWEKLDLLGGVRVEQIQIESVNDPFTGRVDPFDGAPFIFPVAYLLFDRRDNPARPIETPIARPGTVFNDQLLGIRVPVDPATGLVDLLDRGAIESLVNGIIDETKYLPSLGVTVRPLQGLNVRAAWSKTVARPSFREMGYYVSVEPGSDDLVIGNPQLQLSEVQSWDARIEYTWGSFGDLAALSVFYKEIDDPIESIVIRNPNNFEGSSSALFRTFFNNPNRGTLKGVEIEARKNLGFLPRVDRLARYFSIGGNFTYIDAEVDRTEAELARSRIFFGVPAGQSARFDRLEKSRRLFGQPEWIANLDLTFDHPEWGTKVTLAFFAISDILDAAGTASIGPSGDILNFTLDRYVDAFHQLDLVASQTWHVDWLRGDLTLKASAKNLTNSARGRIYDPEQTDDEIAERSFKIGRDFSFSFSYTFSF